MSPCNKGVLLTSTDGSVAITAIAGGFNLSAVAGSGGTPTACSLGALAVGASSLTLVAGLDGSNCFKKLNAGTNGQFLKQGASSFAWATLTSSDVGLGNVTNNAQVTKATLTAKGDIIIATASATPGVLSVGTNGQVLTADSSQSTGVKWATPGTGAVATDTIWDAKGDLAVGTGADTSAILAVGTNGQYLTADSTTATGLKWVTSAGSYTDEMAQDAIGTILTDSASIDFTYDDALNTITAIVIDGSITLAKMANIATDRLIGRDTAGTGVPEALTVGGGLEFTGSGGIQRSAITGDVAVTAGATTATIQADAVTYAKMQNVSATDKILGRATAGSGDVEEITCTATARSLLDDTSTSAMLTTLGAQASDATLTALAAYNTNGLVAQTAADTFTGRTITGTSNQVTVSNGDGVSGNPTLSLPSTVKIVTSILDTNANEFISFTATGSAVNEVAITNAATAGQPKISVSGGDTNISLVLDAKGTGVIMAQQALIPDPVALTDAATISVDASLGNHFRVTLGGNRTLGNPTNATDGQKLLFEIIQDATGSRTLTLDTKFAFGTDITAFTATTTASKRDFLGVVYNSTADKFYVIGIQKGY